MTLLAAENITVTRQGATILNQVSLSVDKGAFTTIIGPNGAGKSMLLKCMMGFYKPDSGRVTRRAGLTIGYVPQRFVPDQTIPITVQRFLNLYKKVTAQDVWKAAEDAGIADLLSKPLYALSGGEMQRVLLTRALLGSPDLLVLDEPAQNLDVSGQLAFYKLLDRLYRERGMSILMVSHDLHMVMASTKQVVCLYHHVCCHGEPQAVTKDPEFVALFGDDMAKLVAVYQHHHHHEHAHD